MFLSVYRYCVYRCNEYIIHYSADPSARNGILMKKKKKRLLNRITVKKKLDVIGVQSIKYPYDRCTD